MDGKTVVLNEAGEKVGEQDSKVLPPVGVQWASEAGVVYRVLESSEKEIVVGPLAPPVDLRVDTPGDLKSVPAKTILADEADKADKTKADQTAGDAPAAAADPEPHASTCLAPELPKFTVVNDYPFRDSETGIVFHPRENQPSPRTAFVQTQIDAGLMREVLPE